MFTRPLVTFASLLFTVCATLSAGIIPSARAQVAVSEMMAQKPAKAEAKITPRQRNWLSASPEQRAKLAENLGEDGARMFAAKKGWQPLLDGTSRTGRQGPDQVYRSADGAIHVVEAKGGSGQLGNAYGFQQGTCEWAVKSTERMARNPTASAAEKNAAEAVLRAAAEGRLQVHVVRTSHLLGEPIAAVLQQSLSSTDEAARLARTAIEISSRATGSTSEGMGAAIGRVAKAPADVASAAAGASTSTFRTAAKGAIVVGVLVDGGFRVRDVIEIERKFGNGEITQEQREIEHVKNAAGMPGGWGGAGAGAWAAGEVAAPLAAMTGPAAPYVEGAAVVGGGIAGYYYGEKGAKEAAEWAVKKVHDTGTTISGAAKSVWSQTANATSRVGKSVSGAWSRIMGD
jgi:hypothetical protein